MTEKTRMPADWIARTVAAHQPKKLPNGNILVFGRLAFCNVLERPKPGADGKERAYGCVVLLPEETDLSVLKAEAGALFKEKAPAALTNKAIASKYHNPFKKQEDQVSKESGTPYDGFVEGRVCLSVNSSKSQPPVVNQRMAPVTDKKDVYSGVWAIVSIRPGWFKVQGKEGPTFYLQQVMVVADDESLGGVGRPDASEFAGISITSDVDPSAAFGVQGAPEDEDSTDIFG